MEISQIIPHIEALIFASDKALSAAEITELINTALGFIEDRADNEQVQVAIDGIKEKYDSEFYAFELKQSGGGWQFLTKPEYHKTVALINGDKFIKRLSTASLETLSIIAYKQPITKSEIESIRGVNCDYAVQKLLEKDLVIISGRNEDAVGKPLIYSTSKSFMDYFGINSADELPKISEVFLEETVRATEMNQQEHTEEETLHIHDVVGESGELHIAEGEVPTHIHVEAHEEEVAIMEEEIKQDKQNEDEEEAS
jgi:segregation and condensation protein B